MARQQSRAVPAFALAAVILIGAGVASFGLGAGSPGGRFAADPCANVKIVVSDGSFTPAGAGSGTLSLTVLNAGAAHQANVILTTSGGLDVRQEAHTLAPGATTITVPGVPATLEEATVHGLDCLFNDLIERDRIAGF